MSVHPPNIHVEGVRKCRRGSTLYPPNDRYHLAQLHLAGWPRPKIRAKVAGYSIEEILSSRTSDSSLNYQAPFFCKIQKGHFPLTPCSEVIACRWLPNGRVNGIELL